MAARGAHPNPNSNPITNPNPNPNPNRNPNPNPNPDPKVSYRELRSQLGGTIHSRRPAEVQTDWQAINLPLPAPTAPA